MFKVLATSAMLALAAAEDCHISTVSTSSVEELSYCEDFDDVDSCCATADDTTIQTAIAAMQALGVSTECQTFLGAATCEYTCGTDPNVVVYNGEITELTTELETIGYEYINDTTVESVTFNVCSDFCDELFEACSDSLSAFGVTTATGACSFISTDTAAATALLGYTLGPVGCDSDDTLYCGPRIQIDIASGNDSCWGTLAEMEASEMLGDYVDGDDGTNSAVRESAPVALLVASSAFLLLWR